MSESNSRLPSDVAEAFEAVADQQLGAPEKIMVRLQHYMLGGVLNPVIEHVGDLSNRMTRAASRGEFLAPLALEKARRGLRYLTHPYGFEREFAENINNNAPARRLCPDAYRDAVFERLQAYAEAHSALPAYNRPQWLAREAAVAVGERRWEDAIGILEEISDLAENREVFDAAAAAYERDVDGELIQYQPPEQAPRMTP